MKIKITKSQANLLENRLDEARNSPIPTNLSSEFKKYPNLMYFSINTNNSEYMFKVFNEKGFTGIKDINPGTRTRGCKGQANLDTLLYNDEFNFSCGGNNLKINNVNQIKFYDENPTQIGSMEIDSPSSMETDKLVDVYEDSLRRLNNGDEVFIDSMGSRTDYSGVVFDKSAQDFKIEMQGETTNKGKFTLTILDDVPAFYDINGSVVFKATSVDKATGAEKPFEVKVKRFDTKSSSKPTPNNPEPEDDEDDDFQDSDNDKLLHDANVAIGEIHKDKSLQDAFYRKPKFMELVMAELKNKQATGSGIVPLIQMVSKYGFNKILEKLGNLFNKKPVLFTAYEKNILVPYKTKTGVKNFIINTTHPKQALLRDYQIGDSDYVLENRQEKFTIAVKDPTDIPDVYICDVIKNNEKTEAGITSNTVENVSIRFLRTSEGYNPPKDKN